MNSDKRTGRDYPGIRFWLQVVFQILEDTASRSGKVLKLKDAGIVDGEILVAVPGTGTKRFQSSVPNFMCEKWYEMMADTFEI